MTHLTPILGGCGRRLIAIVSNPVSINRSMRNRPAKPVALKRGLMIAARAGAVLPSEGYSRLSAPCDSATLQRLFGSAESEALALAQVVGFTPQSSCLI